MLQATRKCIRSYAFFDLETTGLPDLEFNKTKITEMCLVACSKNNILKTKKNHLPRVLNKLSVCVNPSKQISPESTRITGLDNFLLEYENKFDQNSVKLINHFILQLPQPVCLVAHNGDKFDFPILQRQLQALESTLPDDLCCLDSLPFFRSYQDYLHREKLEEPKPLTDDCSKETTNEILTNKSNDNKTMIRNEEFPSRVEAEGIQATTSIDEPHLDIQTEKSIDEPCLNIQSLDEPNLNLDLSIEDIKQRQKFNESTPSHRKIVMKKELFLKKSLVYDKTGITPPSKRQLFTPQQASINTFPSKRLKFDLSAIHERFFGKVPSISHYAEGDTVALIKCVVASKMEFLEYAESNAKLFKDIKPIGK